MAREYERQREQNLMSAWMSGGTFEGKKATDGMVLKFWGDRMKQVSKDDPLYEYYKNLRQQYTFDIAESKMSLKYAQKKVSESQVANFYRTWAKKVPRRSEIYRELMRNAAQFADAARASSAGRSAAAKASAYASRDRDLYNKWQRPRDRLNQMLTAYMREYDYLRGAPGNVGREGDKGEDLTNVTTNLAAGENDSEALLFMMEAMTEDSEWNKAIKRQMRVVDPTFDGIVDQKALVRLNQMALRGIGKRIKLANRNDVSTTTLKEQRSAVKRQIAQTRLLDETQEYTMARAEFDDVWNDPESNFADKAEAYGTYSVELLRLKDRVENTKGQAWSPMLGSLNGELRALTGEGLSAGKTIGEGGGDLSSRGDTTAEGSESSLANTAARDFAALLEGVESGDYGIFIGADGAEQLVPLDNPQALLGNRYIAGPSKMDPFEYLQIQGPGEPEPAGSGPTVGAGSKTTKPTAKERFTGVGEPKVIQGGGHAISEFYMTVPIYGVAPQLITVNDIVVPGQDRRTGQNVAGDVKPTRGDLLGEVGLDNTGVPVAWGIINELGEKEWISAEQTQPFVASKVRSSRMSQDGTSWEVTADTLAISSGVNEDGKASLASWNPLELIDGTVIGGMTNPAGDMTLGSALATSNPLTAIMAGDEGRRTKLLEMSDMDLTKQLMLDPTYRNAPAARQQEMFDQTTADLGMMRAAKSQDSLYQLSAESLNARSGEASIWANSQQFRDDVERGAAPPPDIEDALGTLGTPVVGGGLKPGEEATMFGDRDVPSDILSDPEAFAAYQSQEFEYREQPGQQAMTPAQAEMAANGKARAMDRVMAAYDPMFAPSTVDDAAKHSIKSPRIQTPNVPMTTRPGQPPEAPPDPAPFLSPRAKPVRPGPTKENAKKLKPYTPPAPRPKTGSTLPGMSQSDIDARQAADATRMQGRTGYF